MPAEARIQWLYHYFERETGPFRNLSDLSVNEAQRVLDELRRVNGVFAAQRFDGYLQRRQELEALARQRFLAKGGQPQRQTPHYMVVSACPWLQTWYRDGACIQGHLSLFPADQLSFTYGDLFPTFSPRVTDGREYRRQVYTLPEMEELVARYGLPQMWNAQGQHGPERYIEVQVWADGIIGDLREGCHRQGIHVFGPSVSQRHFQERVDGT